MPSLSRRRLLSVSVTGVAALAGCTASSDDGAAGTESGTATEDDPQFRQDRYCRPRNEEHGGGSPPWFDFDSAADIVVSNAAHPGVVTVTLTIGDSRREIELPEGERWISPDIVDDGAAPMISVETRNMGAQLQWEGERDNGGIAIFTIGEEAISTHFTYKHCPE